MFKASYEPLSREQPAWGKIALLPWDREVFRFPVAEYQAGDSHCIAQNPAAFRQRFADWSNSRAVELAACSIPATDRNWCALLPTLGFGYVDSTLTIAHPTFQSFSFPKTRACVRQVCSGDQSEVERIAELAFEFGRYHVDSIFPHDLSERRYRRWVERAFATLGQNSRIYVTGAPGEVGGFFHVNLHDDSAHITLVAVKRELQHTTTGMALSAGALNDLQRSGVRRVTSKISAANTDVMNFAAFFGFRFSQPQLVFHWHAPKAPHLLKRQAMFH